MRNGEGTKFTIDRKIFSSDIWFASPWKLKVWIYLLGNANHKDGEWMGIPIKRGQLVRSLRTIADECAYKVGYRIKKPSLTTIRRICEELTKDARTVQRTVQGGTLFTIINYNELQPLQKPRREQRTEEQEYSDGQVGVHNKNVKNVRMKEKNKKHYAQTFDQFWSAYPKKRSKGDAIRAWAKIKNPSEILPKILNSIEASKHTSSWKKDGGKFIPYPATWLNRMCWEDEIEKEIEDGDYETGVRDDDSFLGPLLKDIG